MEKMSKVAKALNVYVRIGYVISKIVFWLAAAAAILIPLFLREPVNEGTYTIHLDSVSLELAEGVIQTSFWRLELLVIVAALGCWLSLYVYKQLQEVLEPIIWCRPFNGEVSAALRKTAFAVLIVGGVQSVVKTAVEIMEATACDFSALFLNENIVAVEWNFDLDTGFLVIFGVLYLLSFIFRYGEELQKQADETL